MISLSDAYKSMKITDQNRFLWAVHKIIENEARYKQVESKTGVPWQVIGALHHREASNSFSKHLHNGDALTDRTVHVPKGRPTVGEPPFSWEYSAVDALTFDKMNEVEWSDLETALHRIEAYNGLGYRKRGIMSPYVWAGTNWYSSGKYVADGEYDPEATDKQPGVAGILKLLKYA